MSKKGSLVFNRPEFRSGKMKIHDGLMPVVDKVRVMESKPKLDEKGQPMKDPKGLELTEMVGKVDDKGAPVYEDRPAFDSAGNQLMVPRIKELRPNDRGKTIEFEDPKYVLKKYPQFFSKA